MSGSSDELHDHKPIDAQDTARVQQDGTQGKYDHCVTVTHHVIEQVGPNGVVRQEVVAFDYFSCEEAIQRLNDYLDQELEPAERDIVVKHLTICRPCLERFDFERSLLASLRDKILRISCPGALRSRLGNIIKQITMMLMSL